MPTTPKKSQTHAATQAHLDISEIKEDCVVLKNGSLCAVLLVSSINFGLKSAQEQDQIVMAYRDFLNSIREWPIQIVIQSRAIDISGYLDSMGKRLREQTNELLRVQMRDYIQYVKELVDIGQITSKRFYVVVPYSPMEDTKRNFFSRVSTLFSASQSISLSHKTFTKYNEALAKRVTYIMSGLQGLNLNSARLNTQSLIELFYNSYNPATYQQEKMTDTDKLRLEEDNQPAAQ